MNRNQMGIAKKNFWEDVYNQNIGKLVGLCYRYVSDWQIAEDLAHDSFVKAMEKSETFKGKGHFNAWLRKIAVNIALQYLRKDASQRAKNLSLEYGEYAPEDVTEQRQSYSAKELIGAINMLPQHHRLVFNLYVLDNFTHKQIAYELNITEGTSKSHLARARKKLRSILQDKQKESRWRMLVPFIFLFPKSSFGMDRLFRKSLSNFEIKPKQNFPFNAVQWDSVAFPVVKQVSGLFTAIGVAGLTVVLTGVILLKNFNVPEREQDGNDAMTIDTLISMQPNDTMENCKDTLFEKGTEIPDAPPVVVKKKRMVKKQIIVRDTVEVITNDAQ